MALRTETSRLPLNSLSIHEHSFGYAGGSRASRLPTIAGFKRFPFKFSIWAGLTYHYIHARVTRAPHTPHAWWAWWSVPYHTLHDAAFTMPCAHIQQPACFAVPRRALLLHAAPTPCRCRWRLGRSAAPALPHRTRTHTNTCACMRIRALPAVAVMRIHTYIVIYNVSPYRRFSSSLTSRHIPSGVFITIRSPHCLYRRVFVVIITNRVVNNDVRYRLISLDVIFRAYVTR